MRNSFDSKSIKMYHRKDNYDIAHEWANGGENGGAASSGNLFYSGGCIYSYGDHFMIAKHVQNGRGDHALLFTKRTYSRTTSKHVAIVASASSHLTKLYVADPALSKDELFEKWYDEIMQVGHHLGNARRSAKYLLEMQELLNQAKGYADFFGYELPKLLQDAGDVQDFDGFCEHLQKERALREAEEAKKRKQQLAKQKKELKDWRSFKINTLRTYDGFDYLRFDAKTGHIETTQRVIFHLPAGYQLYKSVLDINAKGGCTNCNEQFLGKYPIIEINPSFIRVGCHKVALKEINRFANQQGWQ